MKLYRQRSYFTLTRIKICKCKNCDKENLIKISKIIPRSAEIKKNIYFQYIEL
ncbi:protein of unknown function [Clostridium beijerinckii]|nr:protein of unknown function [Clostridium beijerinckii]